MRFTFIDKENLCLYEDGRITRLESAYIASYREMATRDKKNKEWKKNSDAMLYDNFFEGRESVNAYLYALSPTTEPEKLVYTFSVNESSGVYFKYLDDEKKTEAHAVSSNEETFLDIAVTRSGEMLGTVQRAPYSTSIAVFSKDGGDYKCLTGGDSKDEHPYPCGDGGILFNSYGVGRDLNGEFMRYAPSEILKIYPRSMQLETVLSDEKYSFIKPMVGADGSLYCIRKPADDKERGGNILVKMLLIPVRIIEAIIGFVSMFVNIFAGKPLVDGKGKTRSGGGAAKNADGKQIFLHNHMLNVEKELKKNEKEQDGGFIPRGWKLVKFALDEAQQIHGTPQELASGVADYCLAEENGEELLVYTNGKRIFSLTAQGEKRKLASAEFCVSVGALLRGNTADELFGDL